MGEAARPSTATVLFTDLVGSTELRRAVGDDRADDLRRRHDEAVRAAFGEHLGTEVKGTGDGLMVVFPAAAEAVAGAVAIQQGILRLNRRSDVPLGVRVGISAGDVVWEGDDCFGTPVVEARRLCDAAEPGQVLTSEVVRLLAGSRGRHRFDPIGSLSLKGLGEVASFAVVWEPERAREIPLPTALAPHEVVRLVGRAAETDVLEHAWKEACRGTTRAVLVAGEPGVGKTRLVSELARTVHEMGAIVLFGRCDEELGVPYQPFAEALQAYAAACSTEDLAGQVAVAGEDLARLAPLLAARLPGLAAPLRADPETERFRLFEAVGAFLGSTAQIAPVLLVIDDLHWAAKPTLLLLRHLIRERSPAPILIVSTYRDTDLERGHPLAEVLADFRREPDVDRVALRGLNETEVIEFMSSAAGHDLDEDGADLARAVHAETEGNPFFVGQVLRHLAETGAIVSREGRWVLTRRGAVGIPEGVREVIGKRLSQLDENTNEVLSVAAVIGREFDGRLLAHASGIDTERVLDGLEAGERARLIVAVADRPGRRTFAHALVRSTLYDEIPTTRRLRLHHRVALALAAISAEGTHLEELAYHSCEAAALGDVDSALRWVRAAAQAARDRLAYEEAVVQYRRGLQVLDPATRLDACQLEVLLARALRDAGEVEDSRAAAGRAIGYARTLRRPELLVEAALVIAGERGWSEAGIIDDELVAFLEEGLQSLPTTDSMWRARAGARLGSELYFDPRWADRRRALSGEALAMAERLGDAETLGFVVGCALWGSWVPGNAKERLAMATRIVQLGRESSNRSLEFTGRSWECNCRAELGDRAGMDAAVDAERVLADELRLPEARWCSRVHQAASAFVDGRLEDGRRLAEEGLAIGQQLSLQTAFQMYGIALFAYHRAFGGLEDLVPILEGMVDQYPLVPAWRCGLAFLHRELGEVDAAREQFEILAANDFGDIPPDANWKVGIGILATVCELLDDKDRAATLYAMLLPYADSMITAGMPADVLSPVHLPLGLLAGTLEHWDAMEHHMSEAATRLVAFGNRPWLPVAHLEHARMLLRRAQPQDGARVDDLLARCADEARTLGMTRLIGMAEVIRASLRP